MEDTGKNAENPKYQMCSSWKELFEVIREEYNFLDEERADTVLNVITAIAENPGTTVQDALNILEDSRTILLRYQLIC